MHSDRYAMWHRRGEVRGAREGFLKAGFESIKVDPAEWAGAVDVIVSRRISKADKDGYGFLKSLIF